MRNAIFEQDGILYIWQDNKAMILNGSFLDIHSHIFSLTTWSSRSPSILGLFRSVWSVADVLFGPGFYGPKPILRFSLEWTVLDFIFQISSKYTFLWKTCKILDRTRIKEFWKSRTGSVTGSCGSSIPDLVVNYGLSTLIRYKDKLEKSRTF